jgi:hypothetical protein
MGRTQRARRGRVALLTVCGLLLTTLASPTLASTTFSRKVAVLQAGNLQGLTHGGGSLWACLDTGDGNARIVRYSMTGAILKKSPRLRLGHCAEIAYREADGTIYAVDYVKGATTANIRLVDMSLATPAVVKTFHVARYGLGQMVAIDNARDRLLLKGGVSPYRFNWFALAGTKSGTTMRWLRESTYQPRLGTPQGLEVVGDDVLFLSSYAADGSIAYNRVHTFSLRGAYERYFSIPIARESEGLAVNASTGLLYFGLHHPAEVYEIRPAYVP